MIKRKLNVKRLGVFIGGVVILVAFIVFVIVKVSSDAKLKESIEYKLAEVGYTENEIKTLKSELDKDKINDLLKRKYDSNITKFIKEKYFIYSNLDRYLDYYSENNTLELKKVVSIVNVKADSEWYSDITETDTSKDTLMLVNKFNGLPSTYEPSDLMELPGAYAYDGIYARSVMYDALANMINKAKESGYTLVVSQGYRSYKEQEEAYNEMQDIYGTSEADTIAARAGHSEYQTGLSVLIIPIYQNEEEIDINTSPEYKWLQENAPKYGFVFRYPNGKSDITGFNTDNWRYRYVGTNVSEIMTRENITFDEYYAYYINN